MPSNILRACGARCVPSTPPAAARGAPWALLLALGAALAGGPLAVAGADEEAPGPAQRVQPAAASVFLEDLTWTELRERVRAGQTVALVPIGGTEQSGPALALGKHNARVRVLAERIARELGDAIVAPVIAYVPEGSIEPPSSHMRFPGTISVPPAIFDGTVEAAARSLRAAGFRDIVLLGDHGGYQTQLGEVAARLDRKWSLERAAAAARVWAPTEYYAASSTGFARRLRAEGYRDDEIGTHAALADTALQLALAPQTVRQDVLARATDLDAAHGVYGGDPRRASAASGRAGAEEIVRATVAAIRALQAQGRDANAPSRPTHGMMREATRSP
jgi:creatinine amidohydrolase/Fe(II)-dependent formamide hydrolase-like protein